VAVEAAEAGGGSKMTMMEQLFNTDVLRSLYDPHSIFYLVAILAVFYVGKKVNDLLTPYDLNAELTEKDNKAIALSFGGYLFALAIILWSVLASDSIVEESDSVWKDLGTDILDTLIWGAVGIVFLQIARFMNDKILLHKFSNVKELVEDQNVGTGAVQCGAYIGSALMVSAALSGDDGYSFAGELFLTTVYFFAGQIAFIVFGFVYQLATQFDLHAEIEKDNAAAGVSFGMTLVAVGIILSSYLIDFDSLPGLGLWFIVTTFLLIGFRFIVDKVILPGSRLDDEISVDQNWGAAVIEGGCAVGLALLFTAAL
jgi:uncharacterized membrane protein YjfL (UPF0719 family)